MLSSNSIFIPIVLANIFMQDGDITNDDKSKLSKIDRQPLSKILYIIHMNYTISLQSLWTIREEK